MSEEETPQPDVGDTQADDKSSVADTFDGLVQEVNALFDMGISNAKKFYWNVGRHVAALLDDPDKYGKKTIENMASNVQASKTQLYSYATIYTAYDTKALARVLKRKKVTASHLTIIATLPTDQHRDIMERRVHQEDLDRSKVRKLVREILDKARAEEDKLPKKTGKKETKGGGGGGDGAGLIPGEKQEPAEDISPAEVFDGMKATLESVKDTVESRLIPILAAVKEEGPEKLPKTEKIAAHNLKKAIGVHIRYMDKLADKMSHMGL